MTFTFLYASGSEKFFQKSSSRIGGTYWKVRYEAFQDETFQEKMYREEDKHLGILGDESLTHEIHYLEPEK
jgi:hypothetical protein